ncbi:RNA/RNP complex-1-interacting phosphatase [Macaca thibetana thibetana]|uniref:RNA/RNP complex-1-interacting phosphatase n=1 Tax=Macaca thibetana thibetana TaxID=257877 RepID=UPI0021BC6E43|nr:RNA/RNP complex-1-interacting phosphatase [Macaca thibetana thibetana]
MRNSETLERCVGGCRVSSGLGSYPGTEGAGLALLAGLALGGRLLGTHMSQWHHPRSGWGRGRDFSGRSSAKKKGGNHIPERWKDYLPVGQRMPGTRFIAFKVPLQKSFEKKLAPEECFSPLDLFNKIREQNEELGLIIDLTYTQRYYKPEDLPESVPYLKIFTVGHQVPDDETIFKFKHAVNEFLKENKDNDKLIGVHCTHGLNRTGYLICRYLIDVEGMRPDDAIELFNRCRGHCLERQNYIEDLQNGPIRKNWNSSVPRSSFEDSAHLMQPVHTMNKPVKRGPRYNLHQIQGHSTPRHFHTQTQNLQQSVRKFSQNPHVYQRGHLPPPGPPGEDCSRRRYSWNVKPNASLAAQDRRRWYPDNYSGLSYPAYWEWTQ